MSTLFIIILSCHGFSLSIVKLKLPRIFLLFLKCHKIRKCKSPSLALFCFIPLSYTTFSYLTISSESKRIATVGSSTRKIQLPPVKWILRLRQLFDDSAAFVVLQRIKLDRHILFLGKSYDMAQFLTVLIPLVDQYLPGHTS